MKRIMKTGILALVFTLTIIGSSIATELVSVVPSSKKTVRIKLEQFNQNVLLRLRGEEGVIYSDLLNTEREADRLYNLNLLEDGQYFFEIFQEGKLREIPVTINGETVVVGTERIIKLFKPFVKTNGNIVDINMLVLNATPIQVTIKNKNGQTVFTDYQTATQIYQKRLMINDINKEEYTMIIESNNNRYIEKISL